MLNAWLSIRHDASKFATELSPYESVVNRVRPLSTLTEAGAHRSSGVSTFPETVSRSRVIGCCAPGGECTLRSCKLISPLKPIAALGPELFTRPDIVNKPSLDSINPCKSAGNLVV